MDQEFYGKLRALPKVTDAYVRRGVEQAMRVAMGAARFMGHTVVAEQQKELLRDLPPTAGTPEILRVLNDASRVGEAMYGQVNNDRLDMKKSVQQSIQLLVQAPNWSGGNLYFAGRAVRDAVGAPVRLLKGERVITQPMANAAGMMIAASAIGGFTHWLFSGKKPETVEDLIYPQGPNGRVNIFAYGKDPYNWATHPLDTALSKLSPALQTIAELWQNKDRFGNQLVGKDHPVQDFVQHIVKTPVPFALKNVAREKQLGGSTWSAIPSVLGITPAPAKINHTPAENAALEAMPPRQRTAEQADQSQVRHDLVNSAMQKGGPAALKQTLDEQVAAGKMTPAQAKITLRHATEEPLIRWTASAPIETKLDVWSKASPQERSPTFTAEMHKSLGTAMEHTALEKLPAIVKQAKAAGLDTSIAEAALNSGKPEALHGASRAYDVIALQMEGKLQEARKMRDAINKAADSAEPKQGLKSREAYQKQMTTYKAAQAAQRFLHGR